MNTIIYIIFILGFFILFILGLIFSIRYAIMYKYQFLILAIAICVLSFFIVIMAFFYKYSSSIYPVTRNPCPDFWELQKDGTCLISHSNVGAMDSIQSTYFMPVGGDATDRRGNTYKIPNPPASTTNNQYSTPSYASDTNYESKQIKSYSLDNIPFGYNIYDASGGTVDFTDVRWSTYNGAQSRSCALKAWANKNGVIWDGISNYNQC